MDVILKSVFLLLGLVASGTFGQLQNKVTIRNAAINMCLDTINGNTVDNGAIETWDCSAAVNVVNMQWQATLVGFSFPPNAPPQFTFKIINANSNKCMTVFNASIWVNQFTCVAASPPNQLWNLVPINSTSPYVQIQGVQSGKCLTPFGVASNTKGIIFGLEDCTAGNSAQLYQFTSIA